MCGWMGGVGGWVGVMCVMCVQGRHARGRGRCLRTTPANGGTDRRKDAHCPTGTWHVARGTWHALGQRGGRRQHPTSWSRPSSTHLLHLHNDAVGGHGGGGGRGDASRDDDCALVQVWQRHEVTKASKGSARQEGARLRRADSGSAGGSSAGNGTGNSRGRGGQAHGSSERAEPKQAAGTPPDALQNSTTPDLGP